MRLLVLAGLTLVACGAAPTSVLVRISDGDQGPPPSSLVVDVFDAQGRIADATVAAPSWPGTLIVRGLPDTDQALRVVVRAGPLLGGERVQTMAHAQVSVDVALHASRLDSDGDGVPDDLDDCPSLPDPLQNDPSCTADGGVATDAGPPDLLPPPSKCATANVAFCDGFEAATLAGHWSANNLQGAASYAVDTTRSYRGTRSLKVHHDAVASNGAAAAAVGETQSFPMSDFFVRVFVYLPSPLPGAAEALLFANQNGAPYQGISLEYGSDGTVATYENLSTPSKYQGTSVAFPLDRWVCVEWEVLATASGTSRLWLDGTEVPALEITENLGGTPPVGMAQLGLGIYNPPGGAPAHDVWYDEVIVDGARVGCDQ